jgi:hypothetical protein
VLPALRLMGSDELGKATSVVHDGRLRGLAHRLMQQWANIHPTRAGSPKGTLRASFAGNLVGEDPRQ